MVASSKFFLVGEMTALLWKIDQVEEDHPSDTNMENWIRGVGLDVFVMVHVQTFPYCLLCFVERQHRFHVRWQISDLHRLDPVVESSHRHLKRQYRKIGAIDRKRDR